MSTENSITPVEEHFVTARLRHNDQGRVIAEIWFPTNLVHPIETHIAPNRSTMVTWLNAAYPGCDIHTEFESSV